VSDDGTAAGNDPGVGDEEIRWAIEHASPTVREVVRRFPVRSPGRTRLATLFYPLDAGLRTVTGTSCSKHT
jgi:hypothetical protein